MSYTSNNKQPGVVPADIARRIWTFFSGESDTPIGGGQPRASGRTPKPTRRRTRRSSLRLSTLNADAIILDAVGLISDSAQRISLTDTVILPSREIYLHHSPADRAAIETMADALFEGVQVAVDDWAFESLDGATIDVRLAGPVVDATLRPGLTEWLTAEAHNERLEVSRSKIDDDERRAALRANRDGTDAGWLERVRGEGADRIRLPAGERTTVGRSERFGDDAITALTTSGEHIAITVNRSGRDVIEDLGSANGTVVGGSEIQAEADKDTGQRPPGLPHSLRDGILITLGRTEHAAAYIYRAPRTGDGATVFEATRHHSFVVPDLSE